VPRERGDRQAQRFVAVVGERERAGGAGIREIDPRAVDLEPRLRAGDASGRGESKGDEGERAHD
jgi:hypothetical protein